MKFSLLLIGFALLCSVAAIGTFKKRQLPPACDDATAGAQFGALINHITVETVIKNATATVLQTMYKQGAFSRNLNIPVATGGTGTNDIISYYQNYFIPGYFKPTETGATLVFGLLRDCSGLVIFAQQNFTHDRTMDWILPKIAPTGKTVSVILHLLITFALDTDTGQWMLLSELVDWDQGSVLKQVGLLDQEGRYPLLGAQAAAKAVNDAAYPYNLFLTCPPARAHCRHLYYDLDDDGDDSK